MTETETKTGQFREIWVCTIQRELMADQLYTGFYDPQSGKLRIPDINYVASTKAADGGYFGRSVFKK